MRAAAPREHAVTASRLGDSARPGCPGLCVRFQFGPQLGGGSAAVRAARPVSGGSCLAATVAIVGMIAPAASSRPTSSTLSIVIALDVAAQVIRCGDR